MINRKNLVNRHNPVLDFADTESPLTTGNGEFAFTADITGLQTLYDEYKAAPLCTMSNWGWHTKPHNGRLYTHDDVVMTEYKSNGRTVSYPSEIQPGNEDIYNWLRQNPHRLNLAKIAFVWEENSKTIPIKLSDITCIRQELDLYRGVLKSNFKLFGYEISVITACAEISNVLAFEINSSLLNKGLCVSISFPYGTHKITASDWRNENKHSTEEISGNEFKLKRVLDNDIYYVNINGCDNIKRAGRYEFILRNKTCEFKFTVAFSSQNDFTTMDYKQVLNNCEQSWENYWHNVGIADFSRSKDKRAFELERRMVLSQYLTAVNCSGSIPPQETGLICNSWYGKFHLEMHLLHSGWFALWNKADLLEKSLFWYESILGNAIKNASKNGYKGARWVKMTDREGIDSPSRIAVLLIWQQPHIIYMLELIARTKPDKERIMFMRRYWKLINLTAEFMCDFVKLNEKTGKYELPPPLIPAQEEHKAESTLNPAFELCYWHFGLKLAISWAKILGEEHAHYLHVKNNLTSPPVINGLYSAHQNCPDTFEKFNRDHPSMLFSCGFLPPDNIDMEIMSATCDKVISNWDFKTAWGWDFAFIAMTLTRLGRTEEAIDFLLMDTAKNSYVASGNNFQRERFDLPAYLPGNGSLLLALALMLSGYGDKRGTIGFPQNGQWDIKTEGISPFPY